MAAHPLDALDPRYGVILCDIWGVVHDGAALLPGARERLAEWMEQGRRVVLVSNAPRPASTIVADLARFGLSPALWTAITTSGEAGIAALSDPPRAVGFLGTANDGADLVAHGVRLIDAGYAETAVTGLRDWHDGIDAYRGMLAEWRARDVLFHCLNPDRLVLHRGVRMVCAGALADAYEALGGRVAWYGKPHPAIYRHALGLAGDPPPAAVLAIGDGRNTDMAGAAAMGFDAVFVESGLHAGDPPPVFGGWRPIAAVASLA